MGAPAPCRTAGRAVTEPELPVEAGRRTVLVVVVVVEEDEVEEEDGGAGGSWGGGAASPPPWCWPLAVRTVGIERPLTVGVDTAGAGVPLGTGLLWVEEAGWGGGLGGVARGYTRWRGRRWQAWIAR